MMENPLTNEQLKKLSEISKLPLEEQKRELQEFLKTLSKEQYEFLMKQQQGDSCVFCSIAEGKIGSKKVYEDDSILAVLDINPAGKGHVIVLPKKHFNLLTQMEDVSHLFNVVNTISKVVFDVMKAQGTNIFVANGVVAGQNVNHVLVHVIPRFEGDGINFKWEPKNVKDEELEEIASSIRERIVFKEEEKEQVVEKIDYEEEEKIP